MKIYLASWPMKKDIIAAKCLNKLKEKKILLSYFYLFEMNEALEWWVNPSFLEIKRKGKSYEN